MNTIEKIINIVVRVTEQGIDKVNSKLETLGRNAKDAKTNVDGFSKSTKTAGDNAKDAGDKTKEAGGGIKDTGNEARKGGFYMRNFGRNIARATSIVATFSIAVGVLQGLMAALRLVTTDAVRNFANFQEALLNLQAIANVSNKDLERLKDVILDVAGSTRFMAEEIAGLQTTLGRLGFSTTQIEQSTESIARFAEATGEDLNTAAEVVAKTLNAFQLEASSAFEVTNQLTTIINNTALSFNDLGTALQYPSSVANTLGVQLEETTALLGVLSNAGIRASRAGTGLRAILTELGAEGGSLIPILQDLANENLSLSEAEELVGRRFAGTLTVLVRQIDTVRELSSAQNELTSAFIASARQNSGINGQFRIFSATLQGITIRIGDAISEFVGLEDVLIRINEFLGADSTLRGYNLIQEIGLDQSELEILASRADDIDGILADILLAPNRLEQENRIADLFDLDVYDDWERIDEIIKGFNQAFEDGFFEESKNIDAFSESIKGLSVEIERFEKAEALAVEQTKEIAEEVQNLETLFASGSDVSDRRDSLFVKISDEIDATNQKLNELADKGLTKTFDFIFQEQKLEELNRSLNTLTNIGVDNESSERTLKTFREIFNIYQRLAEERGRAVKDLQAIANLEEQYRDGLEQLKNSGLTDEFNDFVKNLLTGEVSLSIGDERIASEIESQFKSAADFLKDRIESGDISFKEAFDLYEKNLLEAIKSIDDPVLREALIAELLNIFPDSENFEDEGDFDFSFLYDRLADVANRANQVIFDATQRRLRGEEALLDARYDYERDRLESLVEANLITQEEYERQREKLAEERVKKENEIDKKRFEAEKTRALADIAINTAIAITGLNPADPSYFAKLAIVSATSAAQAAIVASQQFVPVQYEEGGWVHGKRHSEGGVPFTVQGRGGYEMEGGEFIVNRISAMKNASLLERINKEGKVKSLASQRHYQDGGIIPNLNDPLEVIAKATTETANALRSPMRAYVSERELVRKTNARITTERNSDL